MKIKQTMSTKDTLRESRGPKKWLFLGSKLVIYILRYSSKPQYLFLYISRALSGKYKEDVSFIENKEFLKQAQKKSSIRFGDGEFGMLIDQRHIHFQKAEPDLVQSLKEIATNYQNSSSYLLGLNPQLIIPNHILNKSSQKFSYLQQKLGYRLYFNKSSSYFNASLYYIDGWARHFLNELSKGKKVIVVSNSKNLIRLSKNLIFPEALSVVQIDIPAANAFSAKTLTMDKIRENLEDNTVVFLSAGPAGKVMVYELAQRGFLAHDIGHGLDFAIDGQSREHLIKWDKIKEYF